jgi:HK97 family phage prohead protease
MTTRIEKRYSFSQDTAQQFRTKKVENDPNSRRIRGFGAVFNQKSKIITEWINGEWRSFYEVVEASAFDKLKNNNWNGIDVILSVNHRFDEVLARLANNSLVLGVDEYGLFYETNLLQTSRAEDVLQGITTGLYYESSFQFIISGERWEKDSATGLYIRYITEIESLIDVTIATYRGAYDNTSIEVVDGQRTAFREYPREDVQEAVERLIAFEKSNLRTSENIENINNNYYLAEIESDRDKITLLN